MPTGQGSIRLFRFAGITIFLHWSWFLVAAYEVSSRTESYTYVFWNVAEYLSLFGIVLMHEFGHSLACRQVGGKADQIVLWPLGGVAYVDPPQRPGATLWSIAAGPLVNVLLFPILTGLLAVSSFSGWETQFGNLDSFLRNVWFINLLLLGFNLLPVYPLDGGQMLRSLLWFVVGRARSLMIATIVGFVGVAALLVGALTVQSAWLIILAVFMLLNCWSGLMHARVLLRAANAPRHESYACPSCNAVPPQGSFWSCGQCRKAFDSFDTQGTCPFCGAEFNVTRCVECGNMSPFALWFRRVPVAGPPPIPGRQY